MSEDAPSNVVVCPLPEQPKRRAHRPNMFTEARELQVLLLRDARDEEVKPFIRAQLVRAYRDLAELRLRLQGKGPPKAVDYARAKDKRSAPASFTETPQAKPK